MNTAALRLTGALLLATTGLAGCSSSGTTSAEPSEPPSSDASAQAFCDGAFEVQAAVNAEDKTSAQAAFEELEANVPQGLEEPAKVLGQAVANLPDDVPGFDKAYGQVSQWLADNCDVETVAVTVAADGSLTDPPTSAAAGSAVLVVDSADGKTWVGVLRKNDGVTESAEELAALPEKQVNKKLAYAGGGATAGMLVLEPGDYVLVSMKGVKAPADAADMTVQ